MKNIIFKIKVSVPIVLLFFLFSGCTTPKVSEEELYKFESVSLQDYSTLQVSYKKDYTLKWIQPKNKNNNCKVLVEIKNNDFTLDSDYNMFWDGKCKNGYAYGMGREIETSKKLDREALAMYSGEKKLPKYFYMKDYKNNITIQGDSTTNYFVERRNNKETNYKSQVLSGYDNQLDDMEPKLLILKISSNNILNYLKIYPNFAYRIQDYSNSSSDQRSFEFNILAKNHQINGYALAQNKDGKFISGEFVNNTFIKKVQVSNSLIHHVKDIYTQIKNASDKAIAIQENINSLKDTYRDTICTDTFKVSFMDNTKYKRICDQDDYIFELNYVHNQDLKNLVYKNYANNSKVKNTSNSNSTGAVSNVLNALGAFAKGYNKGSKQNSYQQPTYYTPTINMPTRSRSGCTSDYECEYGMHCIKPQYQDHGICMKSVNQYGVQQYQAPRSNFGVNTSPQCTFITDCPPGFQCVSGSCIR